MNSDNLWQQLQNADITVVDKPNKQIANPWYIKLLLGFAGWIGAIFLLSWVAVVFYFIMDDTPAIAIVIGLGISFLSYKLYKKNIKNDFLSQLILAITLAGQGLLLYGFIVVFDSHIRVALFLILTVQIIIYIFINNYILRFLTVTTAITALLILITSFSLYNLIPSLLLLLSYFIWSREFRIPINPKLIQPLAYSLTSLTIASIYGGGFIWQELAYDFIKTKDFLYLPEISFWVSLIIIGLVYFDMSKYVLSIKNIWAIILAIIFMLIKIKVPGIAIMIPLILVGFYHRNNFVLYGAIAALITYFSYYYYKMEITLLTKSIILMAVGSLLLLLRLILIKKGILCLKN